MLIRRYRRLKDSDMIRDLVAEHEISSKNLIQPIFIAESASLGSRSAYDMRGFITLTPNNLIERIKSIRDLGIKAIAIFPVVDNNLKDLEAKEAVNYNNLICSSIRMIKAAIKDILLIADVALDPYTSHGQDGIIDQKNYVDNDATVSLLTQQALTLAQAGADIIAPSDMMDGRISEIRKVLESNGFVNTKILAYSAKYASSLYQPFRAVIGSAIALKQDKKSYQIDYRNSKEALRMAQSDIQDGADIIMIKPASLYLDIIYSIRQNALCPVFAYQVSGEYAMIKLAGQHGIIDAAQVLLESLVAIKRSGANAVVSYAAEEIAELLN